jgi:transcriptional regulator
LKKGSAEFLILSLVETRSRHGYDIARLIEHRSNGAVTFHAASLYPLLYRLEKQGWIAGRWVEQTGSRRRRLYRITQAGRKVLASRRSGWEVFVRAVNRITGAEHA